MEDIMKFSDGIKLIIQNNEKYFIKRNNITTENKLDLRNTFYASLLTLHNTGISSVISDLSIDNIIDVSKNALVKKRNNDVTHISIKKINDELIDMIYNPINNFIKPYNFRIDTDKKSYIRNKTKKIDKTLFINRATKRFLACDGMQENLNAELINDNDIKSSKNGYYGVCNISSLYDVLNGIPINYNPTKCDQNDVNKKKVNERIGFLDQISLLSSNDIIIFDRGYYSEELVKILNDSNIGYIFRMRNTSKFFEGMNLGKSRIVDFKGRDVQSFKYKIKDENFYILTSITDKISINEIKALYWKRWRIETDNHKIKYDVLRQNIRSKNYNSFLVDTECIRFISIVSSFIEYLGENNLKENTKINSKNCLKVLYERLLIPMLYSENNETTRKYICFVIGIIYRTIISIVKGRSHKRRRVKPSTKWNINGNRFGNKH
jgi:hypothetical protein